MLIRELIAWLSGVPKTQAPIIARFNDGELPPLSTSIYACPILAIDFETTGFNPNKDQVVSIGWVPIRQREIILSESRHYLVQTPKTVGQSAQFHGLLDRDLRQAHDIKTLLIELLESYAGYVFLAHHAQLEQAFLAQVTQNCFGGKPQVRFIDTMAIEQKQLARRGTPVKHNALQLPQCLKRHRLPATRTHQALEDAYGCALLFLAQTSRTDLTLKEVLKLSNIY